jgi:UDP-glucose 4-epimerase
VISERWIIGQGLLGQAIGRARPDAPFGVRIPWSQPDRAVEALADGLHTFVSAAATDNRLEIFWSAGRAVTSTARELVLREAQIFERFLDVLGGMHDSDRARLVVVLASSVGGAYAGSSSPPFSEATPEAPASAYGEGKLLMEAALAEATAAGGWRSAVGRLTNIYGPGQDLTKGQGLISVLVRAHLTDTPATIYVPLDTLRDYIYEDDAARLMSAMASRAATMPAGTTTVKIVGSGRAVSVGALVGELQRLKRRRGTIVLGSSAAAQGQALDLRVRSRVWRDLDGLVRTTLPEGLNRVHRAQLADLGNPRASR